MPGLFLPLSDSLTITNVAQLRVLTNIPFNLKVIRLLGYYQANDGGGGLFNVDTADTTTPDDGGLVFVTSGGVRIKRVVDGNSINILWFGARTSNAEDQAPAINKAITAAVTMPYGFQGSQAASANAMDVIAPPGDYLVLTGVEIPETPGAFGLRIIGTSRTRLVSRIPDPTIPIFKAGNYKQSGIDNLKITVQTACYSAIRLYNANKAPTATAFRLKKITIEVTATGTAPYDGKYLGIGVLMTPFGAGGDNNNDLPNFEEVNINNANIAFYIDGFNAHVIYGFKNSWGGCNWGLVSAKGYIRWNETTTANTKYADYAITENFRPSYILNHNAEHGGRLLNVGTVTKAPIYLEGCRWDSDKTISDQAIVARSSSATLIEVRNCVTRGGANRFVFTSTELNTSNGINIENVAWDRTRKIYSADTIPKLGATSDLARDLFGNIRFTIKKELANYTENCFDLGYAHGLPDNQAVFIDGSPATALHGAITGNRSWFIRSVTGSTSKIQIYNAYADTTPITLANTNAVDLDCRLTATYISPVVDPTTNTANSVTITAAADPAIFPSYYANLIYISSTETIKVGNKNFNNAPSSITRALTVSADAHNIARVIGGGTYLVCVEWGNLGANFQVKNFLLAVSTNNPRSAWYRLPLFFAAGSEDPALPPHLFANSITRRRKTINSVATELELVTSLALTVDTATDYRISIASIGGSAINYSDVEPLSGTTTITTLNSLATKTLAPLLIDNEGNSFAKPPITKNIVLVPDNANEITPDFSASNNFLIKLDRNTTLKNPVNVLMGNVYRIVVTQPNTSPAYTLTLDTAYKAPSSTSIALPVQVGSSNLYTLVAKNRYALTTRLETYTSLLPADIKGLVLHVNANDLTSLTTANSDTAGTGTVSATGVTVTGTGTTFTTFFVVGQCLLVGAEERIILAIPTDTSLTIDTAFTGTITDSAFSKRQKLISQVLDRSGLGNNSNVLSGTARPELLQKSRRGRNVIRVSSNTQLLSFTGVATPDERSVLSRFTSYEATSQIAFGHSGSSLNRILQLKADKSAQIGFGYNTGITTANFYDANETMSVMMCWDSLVNGGAGRLYKNLALRATVALNPVAFSTGFITSHNSAGEYFRGDIEVIAVYNRSLAAEEREGAEEFIGL